MRRIAATLVFQATPIIEIGLLKANGNIIIFHVNVPSPTTNRPRYTIFADGMTLEGGTEFAFIPEDKQKPLSLR